MGGNPAAKKIVNYRKSITVYCKDLRYLDDRPVFEDDRRTAEAFNRGGLEEQRAEQKRIREEKSQKHDQNMRAFAEMIENSKREKGERDAMRKEDKYTDETDPVESWEQRCKRLQAQWKEDNKDDLKDEAKEYAEKCLAAEKEGREAPPMTSNDIVGLVEEADQQQKATEESRDTATESGDTGAMEAADTGANEQGAPPADEKPVDNRKLVYDDIWDDVPAPSAPSASVAASPAGPPVTHTPGGGEGPFMPWAQGAVGMDAVQPSPEVLERRKAELRNKAGERADAETSDASKPSWHSKYMEQVTKTQARLEAAAPGNVPAFQPPSRRAGPATSQEASTDKPEPKVEDSSPAQGAGELDEMD